MEPDHPLPLGVMFDAPDIAHPYRASKHAFDLLGVGAREDSYTNLLAAACEASPDLAGFIAERAGCRRAAEWRVLTRTAVSHDFGDRRARSIPDLVLVASDRSAIVLVENKLFSGEGVDQTRRYDDAIPILAGRHGIPIGSSDSVGRVFLTLTGERPTADGWTPLSWADLAQEITLYGDRGAFDGHPVLLLLLDELTERIGWRATLQPDPSWPLSTFLGGGWSGILDVPLRFHRVFTADAFPGFATSSGTVSNRGSGQAPLVQVFRDGWRSDERIGERTKDERAIGWRVFNIHFEIQWRTGRSDRPGESALALELHHETNPYLAEKSLRDRPELAAGVRERRSRFADVLSTRLPAGGSWRRAPLRWNNLLRYQSNGDLIASRSIGEIQDRVRGAITAIAPLVDEVIQGLDGESS